MDIPQGTLLGKKLRQPRQAKRLRITQIVFLGGDRQLLHVLEGLKILRDEFETAKQLLVVRMSAEAEGNLVPEPPILHVAKLLLVAREEIGGGHWWYFAHGRSSFVQKHIRDDPLRR